MADETPAATPKETVQEVEVKGYKFKVDTDLIDDVDTLQFIERIENKGQIAVVLPLLQHILGDAEFEKMKAFYVEQDAKEHAEKHPDDKDYKPRMRMTLLEPIYLAIVDKFDPKG
jgi:hypothetical protein